MKSLARFSLFALFAGAALAQTCPTTPPTTPTTHRACISWTWSQGSGNPATQFNVMRSTVSGGPYTQVGNVPVGTLTFTDQANGTTNILTEGTTYCWVVTAQGPTGLSANSPEKCAAIPLSAPPAPGGTSLQVQ